MNNWPATFYYLQTYFPHLGLLVAWILKSSAIVVLAWGIARTLQERSAAARCWVWRCSLVGVAALLIFEFGPLFVKKIGWVIPAKTTRESGMVFWRGAQILHLTRTPEEIQAIFSQKRAQEEASPQARPPWEERAASVPSLSDLRDRWWNTVEISLPVVWISIGGLLLLLAGGRTMLGMLWLRRNSARAPAEILELSEAAGCLLGTRVHPTFLNQALKSPLLVGWRRPTVYLPASAVNWTVSKLNAVFLHELAHGRRRDFGWLQFGRAVCAVFWWNPLVWMAARRMNAESEEAADDMVVLHKASGEDFARALVEIAAEDPFKTNSLGVSMLGYRSLEQRIQRLMKDNPWRGRLGAWAMLLIVVAGISGVLLSSLSVGLATPAETGVAGEIRFSPEQRAVLERVLGHTKERLRATRYTHVTMETAMSEDDGGKILKAPEVAKLEAWNDSWTGLHRAEYRPSVGRWIDGAAPFYIGNSTQINDGKASYYIDERDDLDNLRPQAPQPMMADFLGPMEMKSLVTSLEGILKILALGREIRADGVRYTLRDTTWQGTPALEIQQQMLQGGKVEQQCTVVVSPGQKDMPIFAETSYPQTQSSRPRQWIAEEIGQTSGGTYYAKRFQKVFSEGKMKTVENSRVTSFEMLPALPAGVTERPRKPGDKYVVTSGVPVARSAITIECTEEKKGEPLAKAMVRVRINQQAEKTMETDAHGKVTILLPKEEVTYLRVRAASPGFAPQAVSWRKYGDPLQLPESYQLKFLAGSPISGKVVDVSGQPLADATVELYLSGTNRTSVVFTDSFDLCSVTAKTDRNGLWTFENFPADLSGLSYRVSCPGYRASTDAGMSGFQAGTGLPLSSLRDGSALLILDRGSTLTGTITDESGKPLPHGRVTIGRDRWGTNCPTGETDAAGLYSITGLPGKEPPAASSKFYQTGAYAPKVMPEKSWVTVEVDGYMPILREIQLPVEKPLNFVLQPGKALRGRVTMPDGKPCAGLNVGVDRWKDTRTLTFTTQTDSDGYFRWNGAPEEPVSFCFGACQSREFLDGLWLQAGADLRQVVMKPALRFSGKVTDAKTGQVVPEIRVVPGRILGPETTEIHWEKAFAKTFGDGNFDWKANRIGQSYVFDIEAKGYKTYRTETMPTTQIEVNEVVRLERE